MLRRGVPIPGTPRRRNGIDRNPYADGSEATGFSAYLHLPCKNVMKIFV
jgi:hypothetical protein